MLVLDEGRGGGSGSGDRVGEGVEQDGGGGGEGQRGAGDGQTLPFYNINVSVVSETLSNDIVFVFPNIYFIMLPLAVPLLIVLVDRHQDLATGLSAGKRLVFQVLCCCLSLFCNLAFV